MRLACADLERDLDGWVQTFRVRYLIVVGRIEDQAVHAHREVFAGQQLDAAAVVVGAGRVQQPPCAGTVLALQANRHVLCGFSAIHVEDVGRNPL